MTASFLDLPSEIQTDIFTFLSVKHLTNILSINKSTHDHLMSSTVFWQTQLNNYSKDKQQLTFTEPVDMQVVKEQFFNVIDRKRLEMCSLEQSLMKFTCMLEELQCVAKELAQTESMIEEIDNVNEEIKVFVEMRRDLEKRVECLKID